MMRSNNWNSENSREAGGRRGQSEVVDFRVGVIFMLNTTHSFFML